MRIALLSTLILLCACIGSRAPSGGASKFKAGAARVDVTPDYPIRLSGYGARTNDSQGVDQRIHATALAFSEAGGGNLSLVITLDNLGIPQWMTDQTHSLVSKKHKIAREQFAITATHTHTAPMLTGVAPNLFSKDLTPQEQQVIDRYTKELEAKLVEVALKAIAAREPAELWWGQGRAGFGANRRAQGGPVDHDVPLLAAKSADGKWKAVWANYACHCTSISPAINKMCGDWAGYAQEYFEQSIDGALSLVSIGCGADINPSPRGATEHAQQHGRELAEEMKALLERPLTRLNSLPRGTIENFKLAFDTLPTRAEWESRASQPGITGYHARLNLARLDRGEALPTELPYSVQSWVFGDQLAMVFLPGEVVVDYAVRLKREYDPSRIWVNAYANDAPCYIPSERIWDEGGYEGGGAMPYYDRPTRLARDTEARIFKKLHSIIPDNFKAPRQSLGVPPPKTIQGALQSFRLEPGLEIELVAAEPLVVDPVAIDFGADGKLWVVEMHDYPEGMDGNYKPGGRVKFLRDTDGDGKFDHATTLANDLPFPTGLMAWGKGVIICAAPDILYLEDTDNDGKADIREKLYSGFHTGNYQARVNSLRWGLDGWVYGAAGLFGGTIHSHRANKDHALSGRDFRFKPDTGEFEPVSGLSQQGRVRDDFGNWFGCDNGTWAWHFPYAESHLARNPNLPVSTVAFTLARESNARELFPISQTLARFNDPDQANRTTSACGLELYRATQLGEAFYHNAFIAEPVHNLVRRFTVAPSGSTFTATRPAHLARSEFLASTDSWFRPAEIRTGPDGTIWVVDMHRFVIEHPRWISPERLAQLDVRAGADKGRIYRVKPRGFSKPATWGNLESASAAELLRQIQGPNGVLRDLAHRQLLRRGSELQAPGSLNASAAAQAQMLWLRHQIAPSDDAALIAALDSSDANVRKAAMEILTLPETTISPRAEARLVAMANDPSPHVRLQLAYALGRFTSKEATAALTALALGPTDQILDTAIASSASSSAAKILPPLLATTGRERLIDLLIGTVARSGTRAERLALVESIASREPLNWGRLGSLILADTGIWSMDHPAIRSLRERTFSIAKDATAGGQRAALSLLRGARLTSAETEQLIALLTTAGAIETQTTALQVLEQCQDTGIARELLGRWSQLNSRIQGRVIDLALTREEWAADLLTALEKNSVPARQLTALQRQTLQKHKSDGISRRAGEIFRAHLNADRQKIIQQYSAVETLEPNPFEGMRLFAQTCASCHSFRGVGQNVGPDIATFRGKPAQEFLVAILDPSSAIEPRFITKNVVLTDERELTGIVEAETANSVTLVQGSGAREVLLRSQITSIDSSSYSLMPEGFESTLAPQQMADLIAYLQWPDARPFGTSAYDRKSAAFTNTVQKITKASERFEYPSWLGTLPLAHCRATDGNAVVEWETAPLGNFAQDEWVRFEFPVGMGFRSQPAARFTLSLNGRSSFDFDVVLQDAFWESETLPIRAAFKAEERNSQDGSGLLVIEVQGKALVENSPARFAVQASAANSQRWFGVYEVPAARVTAPKTLSPPSRF